MCRVIYDYDATDTDELTLKEGDLVELVKKGEIKKKKQLT